MGLPEGLILDVTPGPDTRFESDLLAALGHPLLVCHGPDHGETCPIMKGRCEKVEAAHGVVFSLNLDRPMHRAILRRYLEVLATDIPIRVVLQPGQAAVYADLLRGLQVWTRPATTDNLNGFAAAVAAADRSRAAVG